MTDAKDAVEDTGGDTTAALRASIDQLRAQLAQSRQGTHDFVAMLAHELRTPLGAILMWAHVLRMGRPADKEAALDAIETSAHEQSVLIGSLLDLTRALAGRLRLALATVDMRATVLTVAEELKSIAATADTRLNVTSDPAGIAATTFAVRGDAVRLRGMVSSLVKHSIRATPPGETVDIALSLGTGGVSLAVANAGSGLTAQQMAALFTPFVLAGDSEHGRPGGLGVELPLVALLATLHHGSVRVENRSDGPGSVLTVEIPGAPA